MVYRKKFALLVFSLLVLLSGCASKTEFNPKSAAVKSPKIEINHQLFSQNQRVPPYSELFSLTPEQQQYFLNDYHRRISNGVKPHQALADFMENRLDGFTYHGDTHNASTALRLQKGNCMSLAMITTALAKLVGLEYEFIHISSEPIYDKQNSFILVSSHVQTRLYDPTPVEEEATFSFLRAQVIIDYFPTTNRFRGKVLQEQHLVAKYFVNLAAKQLLDNNVDYAYQLSLEALKYDATHSEAINLLAILHRKKGDSATAEELYKAGLFYDNDNIRLLSNYIVLLKTMNKDIDAQIQQDKLEQLDDPNPYAWMELAYSAQHDKNHRKAIRYFTKAIEMAPYLQSAYQGLYQIYLAEDKPKAAKGILQHAINWSYEPAERKRYKYKLYQLGQKR